MLNTERKVKRDEKSEQLRRQGNIEFAKKNFNGYSSALKLYNQSISYAENGAKKLAMGYGNRSAVYMELKLYKECLANIDLARSVGEHSQLNVRLAEREKRCHEMLATATIDVGPVKPELTYPPHEKIPFISGCI